VGTSKSMSTIEKSVEIEAPVHIVYHHWSQFESFPHFMEGVERVEQLSTTRTHWRTKIAGIRREFDAEIVDRQPDRRIEWRSVNGPDQTGIVTFDPLGTDTTRVNLAMAFAPAGAAEKIADSTKVVERRIEGDLERFKDFVEGTQG
jgi:uncharacterized membrane protein